MGKFLSLVLVVLLLSVDCFSQAVKKVFLEFNEDSTEVRLHGVLLGKVSDDPDAYVTNRQVKEAKGYGRLYVIRFEDSNMAALVMSGMMYVYEGTGAARFLLPAPKEAEGYRMVIVNKGKGDLDIGGYIDEAGNTVRVVAQRKRVEIVSDGKDWMVLR